MRFGLSAALVLSVLTGCSGSGGGGAADCEIQVRTNDGRIYQGEGFTETVGRPLGQAELAACDDTGANARGPYFPEDAQKVAVFAIPGENPDAVMAVCLSDDSCRVMRLVTGTQ